MKHLDLFSGIGGFALAASWCNIETVGFCEIDAKCIQVLNKNFPHIKVHNDIKQLNGGEYAGVDIITGGYPCQPFSVAGNQRAEEDSRHLWPEMLRIITQARPTWVICENVYGHLSLGLDGVLHNLESIGYSCKPFVLPALSVGANHNRERIFIVAYSSSNGFNESKTSTSNEKTNGNNSQREKEDIHNERRRSVRIGVDWRGYKIGSWGVEPPALRVDDGLPNRMDRNRMLGNSIHPHVAYQLLQAIVYQK